MHGDMKSRGQTGRKAVSHTGRETWRKGDRETERQRGR